MHAHDFYQIEDVLCDDIVYIDIYGQILKGHQDVREFLISRSKAQTDQGVHPSAWVAFIRDFQEHQDMLQPIGLPCIYYEMDGEKMLMILQFRDNKFFHVHSFDTQRTGRAFAAIYWTKKDWPGSEMLSEN
jgi:cytosine/adenosine deaminase-related metal-dependent hydrolase